MPKLSMLCCIALLFKRCLSPLCFDVVFRTLALCFFLLLLLFFFFFFFWLSGVPVLVCSVHMHASTIWPDKGTVSSFFPPVLSSSLSFFAGTGIAM